MRFSLKTFLLTTTLLGAGCGLFVHFKNNNPEGLYKTLELSAKVAFPILAMLTVLWIALRGSRPKNLQLAVWGGAIIFLPAAILGYLKAQPVGAYSMVASEYLVGPKFAGRLDSRPIWQELERRLRAGELTQAQIDTAVVSLTAAVKKSVVNSTGGQPLSCPAGFLSGIAELQPGVTEPLISLMDVYDGKPVISLSRDEGQLGYCDLYINVTYGSNFQGMPHQAPLSLVWTIAEVRLNGKSLGPLPSEWQGDGNSATGIIKYVKSRELRVEVDLIRGYSPLPKQMLIQRRAMGGFMSDYGYTMLNSGIWKTSQSRKKMTIAAKLSRTGSSP